MDNDVRNITLLAVSVEVEGAKAKMRRTMTVTSTSFVPGPDGNRGVNERIETIDRHSINHYSL